MRTMLTLTLLLALVCLPLAGQAARAPETPIDSLGVTVRLPDGYAITRDEYAADTDVYVVTLEAAGAPAYTLRVVKLPADEQRADIASMNEAMQRTFAETYGGSYDDMKVAVWYMDDGKQALEMTGDSGRYYALIGIEDGYLLHLYAQQEGGTIDDAAAREFISVLDTIDDVDHVTGAAGNALEEFVDDLLDD